MSSVTVTSGPVSATVVGNAVTATVPSQIAATATVTGGVGPVGPQGVQGPPGNALGAASDVQLVNVSDGDLLRYSASKWRNFNEANLTLDGENF